MNDLQAQIDKAADVLRAGGLVAFPTETVYGLGADASQPEAVKKIFLAKGRPQHHALIVHVPHLKHMDEWAMDIPDEAYRLAEAFWPGSLTLVLKRKHHVHEAITGGLSSVAIRVPRHQVALSLLQTFGRAIVAPSANRFMHVSPTRAEHVHRELGDKVDLVIDAGPCDVGLESTIVDLTSPEPRILRPGAVTQGMLEKALGRSVIYDDGFVGPMPGTHPVHYAPKAQVVLVPNQQALATAEKFALENKRVVVWSAETAPSRLQDGQKVQWVTMPDALDQLGQELYATLHEIDAQACDVLVVALSPKLAKDDEIGVAIRDRLRRASHHE